MTSLILSLSVLALTALVHTSRIPCRENRCDGYNYMGAPSLGYANANVGSGVNGGGYEVGEENNEGGGGYIGGGGGGYEGFGGGSEGYNGGGGSAHQGGNGGGYYGGGSNGGGGYNGGGNGGYNGGGSYNPPRRNNYCPNCYVQHFGNGKNNANTINIKHRRN